ncbi:MAG: flagellar basal body protein, partial [Sedimentisphaerales bacterium]
MSNYSIGISGLRAAQNALDIIGNNIANAASPGYHRQRIDLVPAYTSYTAGLLLGGGVNVGGVTRMVDSLLEQEILRQRSSSGHISQELSTMRVVESAFGELSTENGGLNAAMDDFFNALSDLSTNPGGIVWQNLVVSTAEAMASRFRTLGNFLATLETE